MSVTYTDLQNIGLTESQARVLVHLPFLAPVSILKPRSPGRPTLCFDLATVITRLDALGGETLVNKLLALRAERKSGHMDSVHMDSVHLDVHLTASPQPLGDSNESADF